MGLKQIIGSGVYAWCTAWTWYSTVEIGIPVMSKQVQTETTRQNRIGKLAQKQQNERMA
jgi:hypothetical protein